MATRTTSTAGRPSRGQNKELTPEELAHEPAPDLNALPEIHDLGKLTLEHFHALVALFKENDPDGEGMELVDFVSTFTNVFQQAIKGKSMKVLFDDMDANADDVVTFAEFSKYLVNNAPPVRPELSIFRSNSGVKLPTDHDSPVRVKTLEAVPGVLPSINDISKLGLVHMRALLRIFTEADATGEGLDMDVFTQTLKEVLPGMDASTLEAMFMKVDANSDGAVSWDELSSYILASGAALDAHAKKNEGGTLLQGPEPDVNKDVWHHESISHIECHPLAEKYVTIAGDQRVSLNSANETLVRLWSSKPEEKAAALVPTARLYGPAAIVLSTCLFEQKHEWRNGSIHILAIASADGRIRFFDVDKLTQAGEFLCHNCMCTTLKSFQIKRDMAVQQKQAANTLFMSTSDEDLRTKRMKEQQQHDLEYQALFAWGDDRGRLHFMLEETIVEACRKGAYLSSTIVFLEMHVSTETDWLTNICWVDEMDLLVVTGNRPEVHVFEGKAELQDSHGDFRIFSLAQIAQFGSTGKRVTVSLRRCSTFNGHNMAVKACAWCDGNKVIATAGLDRAILLWDPLFGRLFGRMDGHKKGVVSLKYKEKKDLLVSLDNRSVINIWDPSNQALLLSIDPTSSARSNKAQVKEVTALCINPRTEHLIFAHRKPQVWKFRLIEEAGVQREMYHRGPLVAALVNPQCAPDSLPFNQLVVVDTAGLVSIWELSTGKQNSNFSADSVLPDEIPSAASFDNSCRRLLVCFSQGTIKMYNFSNGSMIQNFVCDATGPISATMVISKEEKGSKKGADKKEQFLLACGWNSVVWVWPSNSSENTVRSLQRLVPRQSADELDEVKCMAFKAPSTLVTGRKDGQIHMWNTITYSHAAELDVRGEEDWAQPKPQPFPWMKPKALLPSGSPLPDKEGDAPASHRTLSGSHDGTSALSRGGSPPQPSSQTKSHHRVGRSTSNLKDKMQEKPADLHIQDHIQTAVEDNLNKGPEQVDHNPDNIQLPFETDGNTAPKEAGVEVNALTFLNAPGFEAICCAACGDGYLRFYKGKQLWGYLDIKRQKAGGLKNVAINVLCTTERNHFLVTGNSKGYVQIWQTNISAFPELVGLAMKPESPSFASNKRGSLCSMAPLSPMAGAHRGSLISSSAIFHQVTNMVDGLIEVMRFHAHPTAIKQISPVERLSSNSTCNLLVTTGKEVDGRVYLWNFAGHLIGEFGEDIGNLYEPPKKWTVDMLLEASAKNDEAFAEFSVVREEERSLEKVESRKKQSVRSIEENKRREKEVKERYTQEKEDTSMAMTGLRGEGKKAKGARRLSRAGGDIAAGFDSTSTHHQASLLDRGFSEQSLDEQMESYEEEMDRLAKQDAKNRGYKDLEPILRQYRDQKRHPDRDGGNNPFKTLRTHPMEDDPMVQHNERRKKTAEPKMRKNRPDSADSTTFDGVFTKKVADLSRMPGKLNAHLADLSSANMPTVTPRTKYFGQADIASPATKTKQRVIRELTRPVDSRFLESPARGSGTPGKESNGQVKSVVREESRAFRLETLQKKSLLPFIKGTGSRE